MHLNAESPQLVVGVVGTGTMGQGIVQVAAQGKVTVKAFDTRAGAALQARERIAAVFERLKEKGRLSAEDAQAALGRIQVVGALEDLADCDVVVEVIIEDLAAKRALFTALEAVVRPEAILATNTSSLSVTAIAAVCTHPERVAGFHFFNPVPLMRLVEVIAGMKTHAWVTDALTVLGRRMGREPVNAKDSPGFLVNHVGRAYAPESLRILGEGIARVQDVDAIMREAAGFRMGPFELLDLVGLDVAHPVMESIYGQYYNEPMYQPSPLARTSLDGGVLGRKTGAGFYEYENGKLRAQPDAPRDARLPDTVWISKTHPDGHEAVLAVAQAAGVTVCADDRHADAALCVVTPLGKDASTTAIEEGLDPRKTVAIDTLFPLTKRRTVMINPLVDPACVALANGLFSQDGTPVSIIQDSPGFVAQRILAMLVNVACNIAQLGVATPADIDMGSKLGLNYPMGPLELGDQIGPARILAILEAMHAFYGEPRYRPMPWLKRRALLGVSLLTPGTAS